MITIFLVRHGKTKDNLKKVVMGQNDSPLSEEGIKTAKLIERYFSKNHISIDEIYTSDLGRAVETANIINKKLQIPIKAISDLRETNYGIYNGKLRSWVESVCPEYKIDTNFHFPKGESKEEMKKRVVKSFEKIEKEKNNSTIVMVTHGGPIRATLSYYENKQLSSMMNMKLSHDYLAKLIVDKGSLIKFQQISFT